MKFNAIYAAILSFSIPMTSFALGLGEIEINSSLNQPFNADIPLLDVGNTSLIGIQVKLASPEEFKREGLFRAEFLDDLTFIIQKRINGKPVIHIQSTERITEPYIELVIDMAWASGQFYREYTVLLDPPGYMTITNAPMTVNKTIIKLPGSVARPTISEISHQLNITRVSRIKASYGPTNKHETVWQIAQRYVTPDTNLYQVVLAIVGKNPDAFTLNNLNGLKPNAHLSIPPSAVIATVPVSKVKAEIDAQDNAWSLKKETKHVLSPPYYQVILPPVSNINNETIEPSELVMIPVLKKASGVDVLAQLKGLAPSLTVSKLDKNPNKPSAPGYNQPVKPSDVIIKAEVEMATSVIETIRESNALLKEQLINLQKNNQQLQTSLKQRDKTLAELQAQINVILKQRQGLSGQVSHITEGASWGVIDALLLILLGLGCGGGVIFWWFKQQAHRQSEEIISPKISPAEDGLTEGALNLSTMIKASGHRHIESDVSKLAPPVLDAVAAEKTVEPKSPIVALEEITPFSPKHAVKETSLNKEPLTDEENEFFATLVDEPISEIAIENNELAEDAPAFKKAVTPSEGEGCSAALNEASIAFEPGLLTNVSPVTDEETEFFAKLSDESLDTPVSEQAVASSKLENSANVLGEASIEFEPNLHKIVPPAKRKKSKPSSDHDEFSIDFNLDESENKPKYAKSKDALKTLISLAKTYISMSDIVSAKQSLLEVMEYGDEALKKEAQALLNQLK